MARKDRIEAALGSQLTPVHLEVVDESHGHNVPRGAESHFKVTVVAPAFAGMNAVARHREIYKTLDGELKSGLHALSLHLFTPEEWAAKGGTASSPPCLGGSKHEKKK